MNKFLELPEQKKINKKSTRLSWVISTLIGLFLGYVSFYVYSVITAPAVVIVKSASAVFYDGYLGILIDRTRNSSCIKTPDRILYKFDMISGKQVRIILPLTSESAVWPYLGEQQFVVLLAKVSDIPPGVWYEKTTYTSYCHWYNQFLQNNLETTNPIEVDIPN